MVDEYSGLEIVTISEKGVKGNGKLGGKNDCFPLVVFSSEVELRHGFSEMRHKVRVR